MVGLSVGVGLWSGCTALSADSKAVLFDNEQAWACIDDGVFSVFHQELQEQQDGSQEWQPVSAPTVISEQVVAKAFFNHRGEKVAKSSIAMALEIDWSVAGMAKYQALESILEGNYRTYTEMKTVDDGDVKGVFRNGAGLASFPSELLPKECDPYVEVVDSEFGTVQVIGDTTHQDKAGDLIQRNANDDVMPTDVTLDFVFVKLVPDANGKAVCDFDYDKNANNFHCYDLRRAGQENNPRGCRCFDGPLTDRQQRKLKGEDVSEVEEVHAVEEVVANPLMTQMDIQFRFFTGGTATRATEDTTFGLYPRINSAVQITCGTQRFIYSLRVDKADDVKIFGEESSREKYGEPRCENQVPYIGPSPRSDGRGAYWFQYELDAFLVEQGIDPTEHRK